MWWVLVIISIYAIGFVLTLLFNMSIGVIELPLCLVRAALWPAFWFMLFLHIPCALFDGVRR